MTSKNDDEPLYQLSTLEELETKSFKVKINRKTTDIFLVKKEGEVYGYQNECPHARSPLEWTPDEFLDNKKQSIQCTFHGALFRIETGECVSGPCNGASLKQIELQLEDDNIYIAD